MGVEEYQSRWAKARCAGLSKQEADQTFFVSSGRPRKDPLYEKFCNGCVIKNFCLSYAIVYDEEGVWGGMTKTQRDQLDSKVQVALTEEAKYQGWYVERVPVEKLIEIARSRQNQREIEALQEEPIDDSLVEELLAEFDLFAGPQQFHFPQESTEQIQSISDKHVVQLPVAAPLPDFDIGLREDSSVSLFGFPSALPDNYQNNKQLLDN